MLIWPMIALGWAVNLLQRGRASLERIDRLLDVAPEIADPPGPASPDGTWIEIQDLTFFYPSQNGERPALADINLAIEPGTTLGVVGLTGAGKTTLVHLLPRLIDPPPGRVLIGGMDVRDLSLTDLRRKIGFVPQDPFLFSSTIRENIAFGNPAATGREVEQAANLAGIHDEIVAFADGYEAIIGERGISLSGGQQQRLAIARALLLEPEIIVLDDPLSAVDAEKEEFILKNLRSCFRGKTCVLIAHRISAVMHLDRIIVLDKGRIVGSGSHDELLSTSETYRRIWRLQQAEKEAMNE